MLMYWPMRLRWSCEMHSPIQTMFLISCSLSFQKLTWKKMINDANRVMEKRSINDEVGESTKAIEGD